MNSTMENKSSDADKKLLLGIDGGGTKTAFLLARSDGHVLAYHRGRGSHHPEIGLEGVKAVLEEGIKAVTESSGLDRRDLSGVFFGIPAFGEHPNIDIEIDHIASDLLGTKRYQVGNDMLCGWAGSLAAQDGLNIVAGTGSIGYGERKGKTARCGGWGTLVSDEGSAYWIAKEGLSLFTRMSDGRASRGALYDILRNHFDLENDLSLCAYLESPSFNRASIASLAPFISQAARSGDKQAHNILLKAAEELALICKSLAKSLGFKENEKVIVSYSGGVFGPVSPVVNLFENALANGTYNFVVKPPIGDPTTGAVLLAARVAGVASSIELTQRIADGAILAA